ncbi:MAG: hypothetical protein HN368_02430, partial [Spirochaetales bacterium]|nr:hypothetical protein [Spirochaetales bacterium]
MRKLIFNDDGGGSRIPQFLARTADKFFEQRARGLEGSKVDTVSFCTTAGTFGRFYHRSKIGETADDTRGRYFPSVIPDLLSAGTDPLAEMVSHCHGSGKEIWWSFRMNDTHDASNKLLVPEFKKNHPEYLLGRMGRKQKFGKWSSVDYGISAVRELAVAFVGEVLENYDIDGIELDFFRHPVFFPSTAKGAPATDNELAMMTDVVREVCSAVGAAGQARSKEMAFAIIIPDDIEYCRTIGLDIETWFNEKLIDAVISTGYFRLHSWERSVEIGAKYDIPVYAGLQET